MKIWIIFPFREHRGSRDSIDKYEISLYNRYKSVL
jgi:hypothetical protein